MHSQPGRTPHQTAWMLFLNGLASLVFVMQIIPWTNYLIKQMLGLLGLYKDQYTAFIIFTRYY